MAFLVFEGIDGAGKSSLINGLETHLMRHKKRSIITREPGGTPLGEELREILIRTQGATPLPRTEALLYQAIRAQHVEEKILPSLKEDLWVLCDRYTASSVAFQAGGRDIKEEEIKWLNDFSTQGLEPDYFILLDLEIEEAQNRMGKRYKKEGEKDRFELEKADFHQKVRKTYKRIADENKEKWIILDANQPTQDILQELIKILKEKECL